MIGRALILVGGGEHACVVADAARLGGFEVLGYSDLHGGAPVERDNVRWLGTDEEAAKTHPHACFVLSMGQQGVRSRVAQLLESAGRQFASIVHPRAIVASSARIDDGAVVFAGAVVNPHAHVGTHAIINTGAIVEHDVVIESLVHVAPSVTIGGGARIGARAVIGLGARVRDHVVVGESAVIGMGAAVVSSVEPRATVMGVPARRPRNHAAVR